MPAPRGRGRNIGRSGPRSSALTNRHLKSESATRRSSGSINGAAKSRNRKNDFIEVNGKDTQDGYLANMDNIRPVRQHQGLNSLPDWRDPTKTKKADYTKQMADLFQKSKVARDLERKEAIRDGFLADPDRKTSLAEAITPRGTCKDMCPAFERVERIVQNMVDPCEKVKMPESGRLPMESMMVKRFKRSAAGTDDQIPSDIRPPLVLQKTLSYLLDEVIGGPEPLPDVHKFVWDRTRAIRNDFSIQQVTDTEDLKVAIDCFETIARFHIVSLHLLSDPGLIDTGFDAHQEREQLNRTLLSLMYYYDDSRGKYQSPNEVEFRSYCIIFEIQDQRPDLEDRAQNWPPHILAHPRVQTALKLYAAALNTTDYQGPLRPWTKFSVAQNFIGRFWSIVASSQVSYCMACVAEIYFNHVREKALRMLWRAFKGPRSYKSEDILLSNVMECLGFDNEDQTQQYCEEHGFKVGELENGEAYLDLNSVTAIRDSNSMRAQLMSKTLVEAKRRGRQLPAVMKGYNVARSRKEGFIDSLPRTTSSSSDDDTLFVKDDDRPPTQSSVKSSSANTIVHKSVSNPFAAVLEQKPDSAAKPFANPFASTTSSSTLSNGKAVSTTVSAAAPAFTSGITLSSSLQGNPFTKIPSAASTPFIFTSVEEDSAISNGPSGSALSSNEQTLFSKPSNIDRLTTTGEGFNRFPNSSNSDTSNTLDLSTNAPHPFAESNPRSQPNTNAVSSLDSRNFTPLFSSSVSTTPTELSATSSVPASTKNIGPPAQHEESSLKSSRTSANYFPQSPSALMANPMTETSVESPLKRQASTTEKSGSTTTGLYTSPHSSPDKEAAIKVADSLQGVMGKTSAPASISEPNASSPDPREPKFNTVTSPAQRDSVKKSPTDVLNEARKTLEQNGGAKSHFHWPSAASAHSLSAPAFSSADLTKIPAAKSESAASRNVNVTDQPSSSRAQGSLIGFHSDNAHSHPVQEPTPVLLYPTTQTPAIQVALNQEPVSAPAPRVSAKAFHRLANDVTLGQNGILEQYFESILGPIILKAMRKIKKEEKMAEIHAARTQLLAIKYTRRWRRITWEKSLVRKGKLRRATLRQSLIELDRNSKSAPADPITEFMASIVSSTNNAKTTKSIAQEVSSFQKGQSFPSGSTPWVITQSNHSRTLSPSTLSAKASPQTAPTWTPNLTHHKSPRAPGGPLRVVHSGRVAKSVPEKRTASQDKVLNQIPIAQSLWKQATRLTSGRLDKTRTDYFRLKSMGIDPSNLTSTNIRSRRDTTATDYFLKKAKDVELDQSVFSRDLISVEGASVTPQSLKRPRGLEDTNSGPKKTPRSSPLEPDNLPINIPNNFVDPEMKEHTISNDHSEDEELFARVRVVRQQLQDSTEWMREERKRWESQRNGSMETVEHFSANRPSLQQDRPRELLDRSERKGGGQLYEVIKKKREDYTRKRKQGKPKEDKKMTGLLSGRENRNGDATRSRNPNGEFQSQWQVPMSSSDYFGTQNVVNRPDSILEATYEVPSAAGWDQIQVMGSEDRPDVLDATTENKTLLADGSPALDLKRGRSAEDAIEL